MLSFPPHTRDSQLPGGLIAHHLCPMFFHQKHISDDDIKDLSPCAFVGFKNPINGKTPSLGGKEQVYKDSAAACRNEFEEFTVMLNGDENDKTPGGFSMNTGGGIPNDLLTNIYILSLGLFGIYIVKKVTEK